jgi:AcrR family transcriptional regulator
MSPPQDRLSAAERRESILDAAVEEFATSGFAGATTADIAKRAGISQPYVFRFFPTKKDLVLAVIDRCTSRTINDWENAMPQPGETRLQTLGRTYLEKLGERRPELMVHLHAYAFAEDPDVAAAMRHHLARIYRYVVHLLERDGSPTPHEDAGQFISRGFLINASMAIGLESALTPEEWDGICGKRAIARIEDRLDGESAAA